MSYFSKSTWTNHYAACVQRVTYANYGVSCVLKLSSACSRLLSTNMTLGAPCP